MQFLIVEDVLILSNVRFLASTVLLTVMPALAVSQVYESSDKRQPTLTSYIVELVKVGNLQVGPRVGDSDGEGELARVEIELSTTGVKHLPSQRIGDSQYHKLRFHVPAIEVQSFDGSDFGAGSTVTIKNSNQIILGAPADRPIATLSLFTQPYEQTRVDIGSKELDGCLIANCNSGAGGRTRLSFDIPEFLNDLPSACMSHNTFGLHRVDEDFFLGPIPAYQSFIDDGIELSIVPEKSVWAICIRKNLGSPYASHQLKHIETNTCLDATPRPNSINGLPAASYEPCLTTRDQMQRQDFLFRNVGGENIQIVHRSPAGVSLHCLTARPNNEGTKILLRWLRCQAAAENEWRLVRRPTDGLYHLVNAATQSCATVPDIRDPSTVLRAADDGTIIPKVFMQLEQCDPNDPGLAWAKQNAIRIFQHATTTAPAQGIEMVYQPMGELVFNAVAAP